MASQVYRLSASGVKEMEEMGFKTVSKKRDNRFCGTGEILHMQKEIGVCETIAQSLLFALTLPFCCCCGSSTPICERVCNGVDEREVFCRDQSASDALEKADYDALGFDPKDKKSMRAFVERQSANDITPQISDSRPRFKYLTFYGPVSKFSYVLLIPNGDLDACECTSVCDATTGESFEGAALTNWAERMCLSWRANATIGRIQRVASETLIGAIDGPIGVTEVCEHKEQLLVKYNVGTA